MVASLPIEGSEIEGSEMRDTGDGGQGAQENQPRG